MITKPISIFPFKSAGFCTFGYILGNGMILIGFSRGIYQYISPKDKWEEVISPEMHKFTRSRAQGCSIDRDVYVLCGGDLRNKVELLKETTHSVCLHEKDNNLDETPLSHRLKKVSSRSDEIELSCNDTTSVFNSAERTSSTGIFKSILQCKCFHGDSLDNDADYVSQNAPIDPKTKQCSYLESNTLNEFCLNDSSCSSTHIIQMFCATSFPIVLTGGHTVTKTADQEIVVIGGYSGGRASDKVFAGKMNQIDMDISWIQLASLKTAREYHISFKMKRKVFVAGGVNKHYHPLSSCEIYSLVNKSWCCDGRYELPFPLVNSTVIVNDEETFALIVGGWKQLGHGEEKIASKELIVFTIENGFKRLPSGLKYPIFGGRDAIFKL